MQKNEMFTSRLGLILAALGMALGTGNIWRFPRIIAENGGGSFLIPWIIFLFIWSIPLLILEFSLGKGTRKGTVGAFGKVMGEKFGWMGAYVGFCAMGIMFYYSVVTGWCFKYLTAAVQGSVMNEVGIDYWNNFINSPMQPLIFHFVAILIGSIIIYRGVVQGIEKVNKILIPSLMVMLVLAAIRSLTLDGALDGVEYLFKPSLDGLFSYKTWLEALTQSAWSTGAGWGLILTYAVYMKQKEDVVLNAGIIGLGDYSISLIAALAVVPVVFAFSPDPETARALVQESGPASTGLTFIQIPKLFSSMWGGQFFLIIFFLSLSFAAISSLISMIELTTRIFMDLGMTRAKAISFVGVGAFILGAPSAVSMGFFQNQDNVWGIGLLVSGFFIALAAIKYGVTKFRADYINLEGNDIHLGKWFDYLVYLIPVQFILLIWWWFSKAGGWTDIFGQFTIGTFLFQWGLAMGLFIIFNKWLIRKSLEERIE